jgi:arylsulfatase A-like enzyme
LDLFPTLARLAGTSPPREVAGRDLWPLITSAPPADWRDEVFLEYRGGEMDRPGYFVPMLGVVTRRYKYTRYLLDRDEELYDLESDPYEMKNLAHEPAHSATLEEHRKRVDAFQSGIQSQFWLHPTTAPVGGGEE